ncbi:MAG: precorrin-2 C(20)-methyltransferase, partial [Desulfonatronovibrio sp.]
MNNQAFQIQKGHFYAVGAGPGVADLLTLRAVEVIKNSGVIICPRSASTKGSLALEIIRDFISDQEIIEHVYPMSRSEDEIRDAWTRAAQLISGYCLQGRTVSQVTLGDPHIYSTCAYVLPLLEQRLGAHKIHVIPGVSAFQASAAKFSNPLVTQEDRMLLMPGRDLAEIEKALNSCETLVLYKVGKNLAPLFDLLRRKGLEKKARAVFNAEMPGKEKLYSDLETALKDDPGYLACVIVHVGRRKWD